MLECPDITNFYITYHRGNILVTGGSDLWHTVTLDDYHDAIRDVVVPSPWMPGERLNYLDIYNYLLESHGELLWASVHVRKDYMDYWRRRGEALVSCLVGALSVSVHALEGEAPEKMRWVRKDGKSLANRVLFLGWPNSFAVDASRLGGDAVSAGCAYFVYNIENDMPGRSCYVLRYNLLKDKTKFVEQLPDGWDDDMCMWLFPQPAVAPNQVYIHNRIYTSFFLFRRNAIIFRPSNSTNVISRTEYDYFTFNFDIVISLTTFTVVRPNLLVRL